MMTGVLRFSDFSICACISDEAVAVNAINGAFVSALKLPILPKALLNLIPLYMCIPKNCMALYYSESVPFYDAVCFIKGH